MCRTKPTDVKEPIRLKSSTRKAKHSDEIITSTDSGTQFTKSSTSSAQSLASVKGFLPDNPNIYTFREITVATQRFSTGKFGNSSVWKCTLRGKPVVVAERSRTGVDSVDFRAKVREIYNVHHSSIIKLLGGCEEGGHVYLVYEYVEGITLRDSLRNSKVPGFTVLSSWLSRMQIAVDVAQGLEYMHHDIALDYVHKYIKSSSIIVVGDDHRAKIAHFGTSQLSGELTMKHDQCGESSSGEIKEEEFDGKFCRSSSRKIMGTQGYMAPEFAARGVVTQKTDVFAFGIVLLELLSGLEPLKFHYDADNNQYKRVALSETLFSIVSESDYSGRLRTWVDPRLKDSYPIDSAEKVGRLAAMCLDVDPHNRPNMRYVAGELSKVYLKSKVWSETMKANKAFISGTFEAR